mmetsp:Transcript_20725/g.47610  ORF Transcript_20725/g.47610 Transcript_20725/m.47610 type:complete len:153 (+) Transcript_20725:388-846(+)
MRMCGRSSAKLTSATSGNPIHGFWAFLHWLDRGRRLATELSPFLGNLCVKVGDLQDTHKEATHTYPLEQVQEDAMPCVGKPASRVPHLPIWVADLPDIDEEDSKRHGHVENRGDGDEVRRAPLLPVGSLTVVALEVGVLEDVGEQDARHERL